MIPTNKKLAVLHPYLNKKGGAVNMMIYLSQFLSKNNNNVTLYTFFHNKLLFPFSTIINSGSREPEFKNELNENKQSFREFGIKAFNNSKIISFIKIAYYIRNYDYIVIGNSPMQFVGVISKLIFRSKAKIIWWHHHYPWYYSSKANVNIKLKRFLEKCLIKSIDLIIVNSKYLQDSIKDIYKVDSKILFPVLDDKFLKHSGKSKNVLSTQKTIFTYGRWVEGKNLKLIFQTYNDLKNKSRELVLKIGGEGDELNYYKNKYSGNKNIIFLGVVDKKQIIENLEKSNLFLFPSKVDSFGLVILESMSIGVPVISYNLSGAKEIVKNGINGFLVNSDSEFIERSYEVLSNPSLESKLGKESIKTARTFGKETFEKQLTNIFNSI